MADISWHMTFCIAGLPVYAICRAHYSDLPWTVYNAMVTFVSLMTCIIKIFGR